MAEAATQKYPDYVTDGSHIYPWNEEYEGLLATGKLRASAPPEPPAKQVLTPKQKVRLDEARRKALKDAETAVALFKNAGDQLATDDLFGAEPK